MAEKLGLIGGSRLIVEACVCSGADIYIGYPITPVNWIYRYSSRRFPSVLDAPDEISALQWMSGFSSVGKFPVSATSFPGYALMLESLNMAYMMELPMLLILGQRLGPSTGSATSGAQGDILLLQGSISGGFSLPVFCPSDFEDMWELTQNSIHAAIKYRTPVVLLTSKEMLLTERTMDLSGFPSLEMSQILNHDENSGEFLPYGNIDETLVPSFLPAGNSVCQTRFNASTHDQQGLIRKATPEALGNSRRLQEKTELLASEFNYFHHDDQPGANTLIVTYGISTYACKQAVNELRKKGRKVSLLVLKTLLPLSKEYYGIISGHEKVYFVEENNSGLLAQVFFGHDLPDNVHLVNNFGTPVTPGTIIVGLSE